MSIAFCIFLAVVIIKRMRFNWLTSDAKIVLRSISQEVMQEEFSSLLHEKYDHLLAKLNVTESGEQVPTEFIVAYLTSIFTGTLLWWIKSDFSMPAKELACLVLTLISNGHLTVMGVIIDRED